VPPPPPSGASLAHGNGPRCAKLLESLSRENKAATRNSLPSAWLLPCAVSPILEFGFLELVLPLVSARFGGSRRAACWVPFHADGAPLEGAEKFQASPPERKPTTCCGQADQPGRFQPRGPITPRAEFKPPVEGAAEEAVALAARFGTSDVAGETQVVRQPRSWPATNPVGRLLRVSLQPWA